MVGSSPSSLLDRIVQRKKEEIEQIKQNPQINEGALHGVEPAKDFFGALKRPGGLLRRSGPSTAAEEGSADETANHSENATKEPGPGSRAPHRYLPLQKAIISECKKASPSMGLIRPAYDPEAIARTYASLGASSLSVLTDSQFFQGNLDHLKVARHAGIPVLRKDFLIDKCQILEGRLAGADSVLLIVRLLSDGELRSLLEYARSLGMEPLVEVHSEEELRRACDAGALIVGINHRDLDSLEMDLALSRRLAPMLRDFNPEALLVAESGIEKASTLQEMSDFADAFLIGTSLMRAASINDAWKGLFGLPAEIGPD
ncbi:MAG: indole-3-glycerol-phosphate synthase [Leptospiraceae bacterium]|nr:indole-3-glycerol-phosphate synthase [Leptospiraceae bacterium]